MMLEVKDLSVSLGKKPILEDISFSVEAGRWLMLIGPNGAGKSTLVGAISRSIPFEGSVMLDGREIRSFRPAALARQLGVLAQSHAVGYSFTVGELVRLGRYAYAPGIFSRRQDSDACRIREALQMTGMEELEHRSLLTLSGGELQRAFLAQLFAQDPKILILDEPTNHLDLIYQKQIFELIHQWLKSHDGSVISVVHDLSLARAHGTHALLLDKGRIAARGPIDEVFSPEHLDPPYGMDVSGYLRRLYSVWN